MNLEKKQIKESVIVARNYGKEMFVNNVEKVYNNKITACEATILKN